MSEQRAPALREWAIIDDAILRGEQIVDLRKGGIHETNRQFEVRAPRFWLWPGYEHQRPELVKPPWRERMADLDPPPEGVIRIPGWADLVATAAVEDGAALDALDPEVAWTRDYAAQRLRWKPKHPLHLLVLRAYQLAEPIEAPWREEYRGCASWADIADLPADPAACRAAPVLGDAAFGERLERLRRALALEGVPLTAAP